MDTILRFRHSRWWVLLIRPLLFLVVSLLVARQLVLLVGAVDWQAVATALGRLDWAHVPVLLALLLLRQAFNSVPLSVFVPGLTFWRGFQNDLTANLVGTVAPPPGDIAVRISMFRSWGIAPSDGMPGVTLNSLAFYVIRFSIPVLGVVLLAGEDLSATQVWLAAISLVVACLVVVTLILVSRGERFARLAGRRAALVAARFREDVDADTWAAAVSAFRERMSTRLVRGLPLSLGALAAMVVTDGAIVLVSLRLAGVEASSLPTMIVLGSFLVAYPLTALPLAGLGVLDAFLVVAYTETAGPAAEPEIVAALVVWRVTTLIGAAPARRGSPSAGGAGAPERRGFHYADAPLRRLTMTRRQAAVGLDPDAAPRRAGRRRPGRAERPRRAGDRAARRAEPAERPVRLHGRHDRRCGGDVLGVHGRPGHRARCRW